MSATCRGWNEIDIGLANARTFFGEANHPMDALTFSKTFMSGFDPLLALKRREKPRLTVGLLNCLFKVGLQPLTILPLLGLIAFFIVKADFDAR